MQPVVDADPLRALLHGGAAISTSGISSLAIIALGRMGAAIPACQKMMEQLKSD